MTKLKTHFYCLALIFLSTTTAHAQWFMINRGGGNPDPSAALEVQSSEHGILIPRLSQAERDAISSPAKGLLLYQTDQDSGFYFYNGSLWQQIASSAQLNESNTDELQNLSINNNSLSISNGNSVSLGSSITPWSDSISSINTSRPVGIGTTAPNSAAALEVAGNPLLLPRFTTSEMLALPNPADGMLVYNTSLNCLNIFNGAEWLNFCDQSVVQGAVSAGATNFAFSGSQGGSAGNDVLDYLWVDENQGFNAVFRPGSSPAIFGSSFANGNPLNARVDTAGNTLGLTTTRLAFTTTSTFFSVATEDTLRQRALILQASNPSNSDRSIFVAEGNLLSGSSVPILYTIISGFPNSSFFRSIAIHATDSNVYALYSLGFIGNNTTLEKRSASNNTNLGSSPVTGATNFGAMAASKRHLFTLSANNTVNVSTSFGQLNSFLDNNAAPTVLGTASMSGIRPTAIAADTASKLYFLGEASVLALLANQVLPTANGSVLAKLNETLNTVEWAIRLPPEATPRDVAVSQSGEVYVCGWYSGTANFGATTVSSTGSSGFEPFLAKYSTDGTHLFTRVGVGASNSTSLPMFVRVNAFGQVAVAGSYTAAELVFGDETFTNVGGTSMYIWIN